MGVTRAKLILVDENTGRAGVPQSKLIASTVSEKLRELQKLKDEGVLSESKYDVKKAQLLDKL